MAEEKPEEGQEGFQRVVAELRQAQQRIENLEKQAEMLKNTMEEIENTKETLDGLKDISPGTEILVPIGAGSYIPAEVKDPDKVLSDLGAEIVAEKNPEDTKNYLENERKDFEKSIEKTEERIEELGEKVEELRPKAQKLMAQAQAGQESPVEPNEG